MAETVRVSLGKVRGTSRRKKASKAVNELRRQVERRTDSTDIRISNNVNERLWSRGMTSPPSSVEVQIIDMDDYVLVEVPDIDITATQEDEQEAEPQDVEEPEAVEDETVDEELEEAEEAEDDEREFRNVPDEVKETLRDGTIAEGKEAVKGLNKADFEVLLNFEEKHQNRKGMKKFLRSNMR